METRSPRSASSLRSGNEHERSGNQSNAAHCSIESSTPNTPNDEVSRKRKAECSSSEDHISVGFESESASSAMRKLSRRTPHDPDNPPFDWQSAIESLKDRAAYIFDRKLSCDVNFIVGHGSLVQRISAHKLILSIGSAVFDAMFSEDWSFKSDDIEVPDVDPEAFSTLLRYLYTDDVSVTAGTVMATLYAAKKYAVPFLQKKCLDFLHANLSPDNAFMLLSQARLFDEQDLVESCLEKIDQNAVEAFSSNCFTDIDVNELCLVLERDSLKIHEIKLFEAVCRWSKAELVRQNLPENQSNQRVVLEKVLSLIRYPLMTLEEVSVTVAPSSLLSSDQLVSIYRYLTVNPKPPVIFNRTIRGPGQYHEAKRFTYRERFDSIDAKLMYDVIEFCSDQDIWMKGCGLFSPILNSVCNQEVTLRLMDVSQTKDLTEDSRSCPMSDLSPVFRFLFANSVKLTAGTKYRLMLTMKGRTTHHGREPLKDVRINLKYGGQSAHGVALEVLTWYSED